MNTGFRLGVALVSAFLGSTVASVPEPTLSAADLMRADLSDGDAARVRSVVQPTTDFSKAEPFEAKPGGAATTTKLPNRDIFSQHSANLSFEQARDFKLGKARRRAHDANRGRCGHGPFSTSW